MIFVVLCFSTANLATFYKTQIRSALVRSAVAQTSLAQFDKVQKGYLFDKGLKTDPGQPCHSAAL